MECRAPGAAPCSDAGAEGGESCPPLPPTGDADRAADAVTGGPGGSNSRPAGLRPLRVPLLPQRLLVLGWVAVSGLQALLN